MIAPKRVILSGATGGIGRAIANRISFDGSELVLLGRNEAKLLEIAAECLQLGALAAVPVPMDLTDAGQLSKLLPAMDSLSLSRDWLLINNAGTADFGNFGSQSLDHTLRPIQVNLIGTIALTHTVLPRLVEQGGAIINVLSIASTQAFSGASSYCASKAGLLAWARSLRQELHPVGIRVSNVLPGAVNTQLWEQAPDQPNREHMLSPSAVADAVSWIVNQPADRVIDELSLTPPKGIL